MALYIAYREYIFPAQVEGSTSWWHFHRHLMQYDDLFPVRNSKGAFLQLHADDAAIQLEWSPEGATIHLFHAHLRESSEERFPEALVGLDYDLRMHPDRIGGVPGFLHLDVATLAESLDQSFQEWKNDRVDHVTRRAALRLPRMLPAG